jgi:branched-chain amino acid transport system ATP-binding protein
VPQGRVVFPMLTVEDNLKMSAFTLSKKETQDRIPEVWKLFPVLEQKRNDMANMLSGGEQVMLSLAKAVMLRPQLLLLDEPSLGLSPKVMDQVYDTILQFKKQGMTVLIVEQNVRKGLTVADNVVTLVLGDVRYQGPAADLEKTIDLGTLFMEGKL